LRIMRFILKYYTDYLQLSFYLYTLSLFSRTIIIGLQNFRCLALKYLWRYIPFVPFSTLSQSCLVLIPHILLLLVLQFCLCFSSYYSCEKAAGVNSKSFYTGRVQKTGEAPLSFRLLFRPLSTLRLPALALA